MRLGFAVATHLDADVLLLDEVFAVGDEAFQRKCFGKIFEFKRRGGTIVFVSHDAAAVEQPLRAGRPPAARRGASSTARRTRRSPRTTACSPTRRTRPSARPACRSGGRARRAIAEARLLGAGGRGARAVPRRASRCSLRMRLEARDGLAPPRLQLELRDDAGAARRRRAVDIGELGWDGGAGERLLRYDVDALPLADGRFQLGSALTERGQRAACSTASSARPSSSSYPARGSAGPCAGRVVEACGVAEAKSEAR